MHSKVQRSATDALCVMKMGQWSGKERGICYVCVYVVCFWQINEPCEGGVCSMHCGCVICTASRGVVRKGGRA